MKSLKLMLFFSLLAAHAPLMAMPPAPVGPYQSIEGDQGLSVNTHEVPLSPPTNGPQDAGMYPPAYPDAGWNWGAPRYPTGNMPVTPGYMGMPY